MKKRFKKGTDYTEVREWFDERLCKVMPSDFITDEDIEIIINFANQKESEVQRNV